MWVWYMYHVSFSYSIQNVEQISFLIIQCIRVERSFD